jgi:hypothetical protein
MNKLIESFEEFQETMKLNLNDEELFLKNAYDYKDCSHELKGGEIHLGNVKISGQYNNIEKYNTLKRLFKTIRLGEQAYSIVGDPLERNVYRPLIIHKTEIYDYEKYRKRISKSITMGFGGQDISMWEK